MAVVLTGGAGYIGTHCCVTLIESGFDVIVVCSPMHVTGRFVQSCVVAFNTHFVDCRDLGRIWFSCFDSLQTMKIRRI